MATTLTQKEIDELLNTSASTDDEKHQETVKSDHSEGKTHFFKPNIIKKTITVPYFSPVLKNDNILFNPNNKDTSDENSKKVVWSIEHYSKMLHNRKV